MQQKIKDTIDKAQIIVVVQADNPDADSLASALALEQILGDMGKEVHMYCGVVMPGYLRYLPGWDRVQDELPIRFDASIIVDTSANILLEQLNKLGSIKWLKTKPCIVLDHHTASTPDIDFASVMYLQEAVATGELIYELSNSLGWARNKLANNAIMTSILSDSLGMTSEGTSARSIAIVSELVEQGVSIPKLENDRRAMQKKSPELVKYKAELLSRIEYSQDHRVAYILIPWDEIEKYSHQYNPSILVLDEMRHIHDVAVAIAFKTYPDGRITGKLRANYGYGVAAQVAQHFGGGGHPYAAGFRITNGKSYNEVKSECIQTTLQLLDTLKSEEDTNNETTQYTHTVG